MTSTTNFKNVPAALLDMFDIDTLYVKRAPYYRWFSGLEVDPDMLEQDPVVTLAQAEHFQREAHRLSIMDIDPALLTSPAAKVAAVMGQFGMSKEAVWFYDPFLHRSNQGYADLVGIKLMFEYIQSNYGQRKWFTHKFQLKLLTRMMEMEPKNLKLAFEQLYFGKDSPGWMNASEREGAIEAVKEAISIEARDGLHMIWKGTGGRLKAFLKLWNAYVAEMLGILVMVAEKAHKYDVRLGRPAYEIILEGLRIGHDVDEIYLWALFQYARLETEMDRLAYIANCEGWQDYWEKLEPGPIMTDAELLAFYHKDTEMLIRVFRENGIIPAQPDNYQWQMKITPPESQQSIPTAMYTPAPYHTENPGDIRTGSFYITPAGTDILLRQAHWLERLLTIAHEMLGHGSCNAHDNLAVPGSYGMVRQALLLANEGVAVTMESAYFRCKGVQPTLQEMMVALKSLAWRCARIIAEIEWHVKERPLKQITIEYAARAGLSNEAATRDIRRATTQVWEFLAYALGAAGIEALGTHMGSTLKALHYTIESCAGLVPQNLAAWAEGFVQEPEDFNWLVDFELPDISRRFFPDAE